MMHWYLLTGIGFCTKLRDHFAEKPNHSRLFAPQHMVPCAWLFSGDLPENNHKKNILLFFGILNQ